MEKNDNGAVNDDNEAANNEVAKIYKRKQIESASPGQLIVMLYEAALDRLNKAEKIMKERKDPSRIEEFHNNIVTCQNIITELTVALDMEKGGEIASNLFRLYDFCNWRLVDVNVKKDLKGISEVREVLTTLKSGWDEIKDTSIPENEVRKTNRGLNLKG